MEGKKMEERLTVKCDWCGREFSVKGYSTLRICRQCLLEDAREFQKFVKELKDGNLIPEDLKPYLSMQSMKKFIDSYRDAVGRSPWSGFEKGSEEFQQQMLQRLIEELKKGKEVADKLFSVLKDEIESGVEEMDFRPHSRFPSDLEMLGDNNREKLMALLKENGYIRVSKWIWRKWNIKPEVVKFWEEHFEGKVDEQYYPIYAGFQLLLRTKPFRKDWLGFDAVDCWIALRLYSRNKVDEKLWSWLRRKLPRYEQQIKELGLDYDRLIRALNLSSIKS